MYDFDNIIASIKDDQIDLSNIYSEEFKSHNPLKSLYYVIDISTS